MSKVYDIKTKILGPNADKGELQEVRVLNRVITWTPDGLTYEADQRHSELIIQELGLEGAKAVTTPGNREEVERARAENEQQGLLGKKEAAVFRGLSARLNYLAQDRADLMYPSKEISRKMANPGHGDWGLLKRVGRYLIGAPRLVQHFHWQCMPKNLVTHVDSDWAGCKASCKSTSGGVISMGLHVIKGWSTTQSVIALSSGEAELYALVKGSAQTLGAMSMAQDFGYELGGGVMSDSSAAIGITSRQGLGKLRHINVQYLWVQEKFRTKELQLDKVPGEQNPADLYTKYLDQETIQKHLDILDMTRTKDRAATAPTLALLSNYNKRPMSMHAADAQAGLKLLSSTTGVLRSPRVMASRECFHGGASGHSSADARVARVEGEDAYEVNCAKALSNLQDVSKFCQRSGREHRGQPDEDKDDDWLNEDYSSVRVHRAPRFHLFTPLGVSMAPPARSIFSVRITEGVFCDNGEQFKLVDSWRNRAEAHLSLGRPWTGATRFFVKEF